MFAPYISNGISSAEFVEKCKLGVDIAIKKLQQMLTDMSNCKKEDAYEMLQKIKKNMMAGNKIDF